MPGREAEFDYVIVGAGSSGCVLANRLSADASRSVAVIEAGPRDKSFWIHLPIGYGRTMWDPAVNWKFHTEPEPNMAGRRIYWPRGRVLGGSSSINGLIVIRGQPQDYDRWANSGARGWSWNEVLPYFVKLENNADFAGDQLHGTNGPLPISPIAPASAAPLELAGEFSATKAFQAKMSKRRCAAGKFWSLICSRNLSAASTFSLPPVRNWSNSGRSNTSFGSSFGRANHPAAAGAPPWPQHKISPKKTPKAVTNRIVFGENR